MEELGLPDYRLLLRRHKKLLLLVFALLWGAAVVFALSWSNCRSTATIEIAQPEIERKMTDADGPNESLADLRISKIQQKVTTVGSLVGIITKFNLYPEARKYLPMAVVAERMRQKINLDLIGASVANPAATQKVPANQLSAIAFNLSFDYNDPQIAQQVANELATLFLDEDLKDRHAQAQETSNFLAAQIAALEASLAEQEKKISAYQETHGDSRPENLLFNQQAAANITLTLQTLDSQMAANEGTQGSLRAQLALIPPYSRVLANGQVLTTPETQLKALKAQYATLTAQYGREHPDVVKARHQIEALQRQVGSAKKDTAGLKAQIADLRTNLDAAQKTYGPDHPDAVVMKNQLKKLEDRLAPLKNSPSDDDIKTDADNPAYLQIVAQLKSTEEQHKTLLVQREALVKQQEKYSQAVEENPAVVQQIASLSRDYDNAQMRYRALKEKKMAADMSLQMEQDRKGQRLVLINPPSLPLKTYPSRLLFIAAGFVLALIGSAGFVFFVHFLSRAVLGSNQMTSLAGVPPLVTIPHIFTTHEIERKKRHRRILLGVTPFALLLAMVVFSYTVMPLDVFLGTALQRLGLS